jgi:hypothetical protein
MRVERPYMIDHFPTSGKAGAIMIQTHPDDPPLTAAEAARVAWLIGRMAKRGIAGEDVDQTDLLRKLDRILDGARKRAEKAAAAAGK